MKRKKVLCGILLGLVCALSLGFVAKLTNLFEVDTSKNNSDVSTDDDSVIVDDSEVYIHLEYRIYYQSGRSINIDNYKFNKT